MVLLEDIWNWATTTDDATTAQILWLADVAGAGKSALAHSVAQRCHEHGVLVSSFFFDRETAGRNGPQKLFTAIARGLSRFDHDVANQIAIALEHDPDLAFAPISRQFDELILKPSQHYSGHHPAVAVVDALDEGYDFELLTVLRDKIPNMPRTFRFFFTSRAEDEIVSFLDRQPHIQMLTMRIHEQSNQSDVAVYVRHRLRDIATRRYLAPDWPGEPLLHEFITKAEGLFIWVATICDYLRLKLDPSKHLISLLSNHGTSGQSAESMIDGLYATILSSCPWDDEDFATGYDLLVGAIMATKTPLLASALQNLYRESVSLSVKDILRPLGSLLTGLDGQLQPIRILHLSFRDFITTRAQHSPGTFRYYVNEKEHSERLALMCLGVMNEKLKRNICGIIDQSKEMSEIEGLQDLVEENVCEELAYACSFWTDHFADVTKQISPGLMAGLRELLTKKLLFWIEVMTLKALLPDATESLFKLWCWHQVLSVFTYIILD
jgi:hypothetical protein